MHLQTQKLPVPVKPSPLMICDQLLRLAQDADRCGLAITAEHLVHLATEVFEERPRLLRA